MLKTKLSPPCISENPFPAHQSVLEDLLTGHKSTTDNKTHPHKLQKNNEDNDVSDVKYYKKWIGNSHINKSNVFKQHKKMKQREISPKNGKQFLRTTPHCSNMKSINEDKTKISKKKSFSHTIKTSDTSDETLKRTKNQEHRSKQVFDENDEYLLSPLSSESSNFFGSNETIFNNTPAVEATKTIEDITNYTTPTTSNTSRSKPTTNLSTTSSQQRDSKLPLKMMSDIHPPTMPNVHSPIEKPQDFLNYKANRLHHLSITQQQRAFSSGYNDVSTIKNHANPSNETLKRNIRYDNNSQVYSFEANNNDNNNNNNVNKITNDVNFYNKPDFINNKNNKIINSAKDPNDQNNNNNNNNNNNMNNNNNSDDEFLNTITLPPPPPSLRIDLSPWKPILTGNRLKPVSGLTKSYNGMQTSHQEDAVLNDLSLLKQDLQKAKQQVILLTNHIQADSRVAELFDTQLGVMLSRLQRLPSVEQNTDVVRLVQAIKALKQQSYRVRKENLINNKINNNINNDKNLNSSSTNVKSSNINLNNKNNNDDIDDELNNNNNNNNNKMVMDEATRNRNSCTSYYSCYSDDVSNIYSSVPSFQTSQDTENDVIHDEKKFKNLNHRYDSYYGKKNNFGDENKLASSTSLKTKLRMSLRKSKNRNQSRNSDATLNYYHGNESKSEFTNSCHENYSSSSTALNGKVTKDSKSVKKSFKSSLTKAFSRLFLPHSSSPDHVVVPDVVAKTNSNNNDNRNNNVDDNHSDRITMRALSTKHGFEDDVGYEDDTITKNKHKIKSNNKNNNKNYKYRSSSNSGYQKDFSNSYQHSNTNINYTTSNDYNKDTNGTINTNNNGYFTGYNSSYNKTYTRTNTNSCSSSNSEDNSSSGKNYYGFDVDFNRLSGGFGDAILEGKFKKSGNFKNIGGVFGENENEKVINNYDFIDKLYNKGNVRHNGMRDANYRSGMGGFKLQKNFENEFLSSKNYYSLQRPKKIELKKNGNSYNNKTKINNKDNVNNNTKKNKYDIINNNVQNFVDKQPKSIFSICTPHNTDTEGKRLKLIVPVCIVDVHTSQFCILEDGKKTMVVGEVDVCDRMDWKELDRVVVHRFQTFVHIIDPEEDIGLKVNSIKHYTIGDHVRFLGTPPPELLPIGYIVGDVKSIHLKLKDHEDDRIDAFAFDSLLPISILQAHLQSLWKHKRFLLVGCPKSGKTYLGRLLAYHVASLLSKNSPTFASELINEYNFSNFKSDQSLPSILSAKKPVLLLDNLHHVTSLPNHSQDIFDFLPQKIIIIITIDSSSFSSSSLVESLRDKHQFAIVSVDTIYKNNNINNQKNDSQNNKNNINNRSKTRSLIKQQEGGEFLSRFHKRICFLFHYHLHINREMGGWMDEKGIVKDRWMDDRNQLCFNTHIDDETLKRNNKNTNSKNEKNKKNNNNNDTNFHYNNLKLSTNKSSKTNPQHSHDMRIIRHQKTVKWLEDLWDRLEGLGVGVSPLLFVSAPQQPSLSELWFVRLWNLSIVPVIRCRINNKNNKKNNNKNKTKKIDENGDVEKNKNERKKADENEMGNGRSNEIAQINTNMKAQLRATKKCCDNAVDSNDDDEEDDDDDGDEEDGGDDSDCHSLNAHAWERFVKWLLDTYPWDKNKSNNITNCNNKNNEKNDFNENEGTKMIENNSINININNKDKNDLLLRLFGQEGDRENVNKNNDNNGKNKNNDSNRNNNENNKHKNNNNNSNINENKDNNSNFYDDDVEDVIEEKLRVLVDEIEEEDEDGCDDNDSRKTYDKTLKKNGDKKGDVKKKKNIENEVLNKLDSLVSLSGDDDDEEVEDEDILLIQEDDE